MPRLLEYTSVLQKSPCAVITERALPWLTKEECQSRPFMFCDDILNVGSTLDHHVAYAEEHLGVIPSIRVFATREKMATLHSRSPLQAKDISVDKTFDEAGYWEFETDLPQRLLTLGKPYDIDFPLLYCPLTEEAAQWSAETWFESLQGAFSSVWNLTIPRQAEAGILSFSLIEPIENPMALPVHQAPKGNAPPPKIRIYVNQRDKQLVFAPMCIPAISSEFLKSGPPSVCTQEIKALWDRYSELPMIGTPFSQEPLYNFLVYLLSFDYGHIFVPYFSDAIPKALAAEPKLDELDAGLLFGPSVATVIVDCLNAVLAQRVPPANRHVRSATSRAPETTINPRLVETISQSLLDAGFQGASPSKVFREVFRVLDSIAKGNDPDVSGEMPEYDRLRRGVSLCDLWLLISRHSNRPGIAIDEMSFLLDYFIDIGAVVPIVENVDGVYIRSYRRGEADPIEMAQVLHGLLKMHEELFPGCPMKKTAFTKILSALAVYHGDLLPLEPVFEFRGMMSYVRLDGIVGDQFEETVEFLRKKNVIELRQAEPPKDDSQMVLF